MTCMFWNMLRGASACQRGLLAIGGGARRRSSKPSTSPYLRVHYNYLTPYYHQIRISLLARCTWCPKNCMWLLINVQPSNSCYLSSRSFRSTELRARVTCVEIEMDEETSVLESDTQILRCSLDSATPYSRRPDNVSIEQATNLFGKRWAHNLSSSTMYYLEDQQQQHQQQRRECQALPG